MSRVRKEEFAGLLSPSEYNSDQVRMWAKSERYRIVGGAIYPEGSETTFTFPLSDPGLFLSFARLGARGEPSEPRILQWVEKNGLPRGEDSFWNIGPDKWLNVVLTAGEYDQFLESLNSRIKQHDMSLEDFRTEVRLANQLLNLYADIRAEDLPAIQGRFTTPPDFPRLSRPTVIDRYLKNAWDSPLGGEHEVAVAEKGIQPLPDYYGRSVGLLRSSLKYAVRDVRLSLTDDDLIERPPTLSQILVCPDLLSAMYLQFYYLVTARRPMRRCKNPPCGLPFPITRKDRWHCNDTCRSNARNYP